MAARKPIETAPKDGSKVTVTWKDSDGVINESIAQYRSLDRLRAAGGDWDESDAGWWTYVDSDTQKRIEPHGWKPAGQEEEDE
jgi:hypothetical protein